MNTYEKLGDSLVVIKMETRQNKPVLNLQCCSKLLDSGSAHARARRAVIFEFLTSVRGDMIMTTAFTKPSKVTGKVLDEQKPIQRRADAEEQQVIG